MELLKFSKFKLQLQSLIREVRDLRGRERSVTDQLHLVNQRQKQTEEECSRKVQELQAELASSRELQEKLERKVNYLESDYVLLENKQNELKTTTQSLLQSRESFLNAYQESFYEMKRSIETRDRKIAILYEKINSHLSLFDSIEKEALAIKKVIQDVHGVVGQKEDVVACLKEKMDQVSTFERTFMEKISKLEDKIKDQETELQSKEIMILELSTQLESAKIKNDCQAQVEELQKIMQAKDLVVENLISEKEALHSEVRSLERILQRIQDSVSIMNEEDKRVFTSILTCQQGLATQIQEDIRYNHTFHNMGEPPSKCKSPTMLTQENTANTVPSPSPLHQNHNSDSNSLQEANQLASPECRNHNFVNDAMYKTNNPRPLEPEILCSSPESTCSQRQSTARALSAFSNIRTVKGEDVPRHLDSECSTTQPSQNL